MLDITMMTLGPASTNCYIVSDADDRETVIIDPAWDGRRLANEVEKRQLFVKQIWLTHAHFDHFGGLADLHQILEERQGKPVNAGMHSKERMLWKVKGGAALFGVRIKNSPRPVLEFQEGDEMTVGRFTFRILHAPGHSPGHVMFYCESEHTLFAGDVIFQAGIGRTDLLGGNYQTLLDSIRTKVLSLPEDTKIYPGHGPTTTVGEEQRSNPFLS